MPHPSHGIVLHPTRNALVTDFQFQLQFVVAKKKEEEKKIHRSKNKLKVNTSNLLFLNR
tara:strand:+ start:151 stop:327 length:177 start_codon:yes stop_codon:yes gene_type:complete